MPKDGNELPGRRTHMNIGIVGLGLIGGSVAKAIKQNTEHSVYGTDLKESVIYKAKLIEAIDDRLTEEILGICDMVIIAVYPGETIKYIEEHQKLFQKGCLVLDCCGVKEAVCGRVRSIAAENGFTFVGAHPMAGVEFSGFEHSQKTLFRNASMILTPEVDMTIQDMEKLKKLWVSIGFTNVQISNPKEHDRRIAYTSQLAHVVSSAYIKSPTAEDHKGFSAGSFKDLSRVAKLNPTMWTELFLLNRENLTEEISTMIRHLEEYRDAISQGNEKDLWNLLNEGTERKILIDKNTKK